MEEQIEIDLATDPWNSKQVHKLFLPVGNEHPKDAIARWIDILMDARTTTDGYKCIINGGDVHDNCTKRDIFKLNDKCLYLISALNTALTCFPEKNWRDCCNESSKICSVLTTPYSGRTVEDWWTTFREKNSFPIHAVKKLPLNNPLQGFHQFCVITITCDTTLLDFAHCT
jgi:hypothetical protein